MNASGALPANVQVITELPADHPGYSIVDAAAMRALSIAEQRHFWHAGRNAYVAKRLSLLSVVPPARVLELGCGGGAVSARLSAMGYVVTGVDGHLPRVVEAAHRAPAARFVVYDLARGAQRLSLGEFEAVGLFDVLEHLDDPGAALADALQCVQPGGVLVGTVPALMSLWSRIDELAGHRCRYERAELVRLLRSVRGAEVVEVRPFNRAIVPVLWLQRRLVAAGTNPHAAERNLRVPPAPINGALRALLRLEYGLGSALDRAGLPGASLWFALRRSGKQKDGPGR